MHPQLYVFHETHWLPKMYEFFGTGEAEVRVLTDIIRRTRFVTGDIVTPFDLEELQCELAGRKQMTVAEYADAIGLLFARQQGKKLWADKTPDYGPYLNWLQTLWPKCRCVHIIRHGEEVALSMSGHPGFRWMACAREMWWVWPSFNNYHEVVQTTECELGKFVDLWYRRFLRIRNEASRLTPGSYLEVKFEDLIGQPEATLKEIATFLELASPQDWLTAASGLVNVDAIRCRGARIPAVQLEPQHLKLLSALGYDGSTSKDD